MRSGRANRTKGTITLVIQAVGRTTYMLMELKQGESVDEVFGPLGHGRHCGPHKKVICGGGVGVAGVYPHLCQYSEMGGRSSWTGSACAAPAASRWRAR